MSQRLTYRNNNLAPKRTSPQVYPFSAIVGQEEMKLALLLNVIDPLIGGVLIMGHRGTGKSTAVRSIADLLPQVWRVTNCHYGCDPVDIENLCDDCFESNNAKGKLSRTRAEVPVVTLPLGATEDRVCGTIDIQRALKEGVKAFEPGLIARANRGFLYVDEVNLLEDHLVDLLLDVAVTGRNTVEREGMSLEHPARFVLVGSGNPEEGELRPQLVDRFGLCAEVETLVDLSERIEIVKLREAFDHDATRFRATFESDQQSLRRRLTRARKLAGHVNTPKDLMRNIAGLCLHLKIDGHRGELTIARASRALAAFEGRRKVREDDIRRVTALALRHRLRRDPLEPTSGGGVRIEQALDSAFPQSKSGLNKTELRSLKSSEEKSGTISSPRMNGFKGADDSRRPPDDYASPTPASVDAKLSETTLEQGRDQLISNRTTRRIASRQRGGNISLYNFRQGRYARAVVKGAADSRIALDATLRAAALSACGNLLHLGSREDRASSRYVLASAPCYSDLRFKAFKRKQGTLFIIAIDTSGSMAANRIEMAKGALVWLLNRSYVKRDRVALVSFRGDKAEELLQPSQSTSRARRVLDELLMGGSTPLASGIASAVNIAARARRQGTERIHLLVFTDGHANVSLRHGETRYLASDYTAVIADELDQLSITLREIGVTTVIVDTQSRFTSRGEGRVLAERLGARYVLLPSGVGLADPQNLSGAGRLYRKESHMLHNKSILIS